MVGTEEGLSERFVAEAGGHPVDDGQGVAIGLAGRGGFEPPTSGSDVNVKRKGTPQVHILMLQVAKPSHSLRGLLEVRTNPFLPASSV